MYIERRLFDLIVIKLTVASILMIVSFVRAIRKQEDISSNVWSSNGFCIITTLVLWIISICGGNIS